MLRFDQFQLKPSHRTPEGYLLCSASAARAGVLVYRNDDGTIRRELVPEEELQRADSLGSAALKPVVDGHPKEGRVDATNARELQRGVSLQNVQYAGGYVNVEILITDDELAEEIERGDKREISMGYRLEDLEKTPGTHPKYGRYDAIQRGRICNHIAAVKRGRAGSSVAVRVDEADAWTYSEAPPDEVTEEDDLKDNQSKEDSMGTENKQDEKNKADSVDLSEAIADATKTLKSAALKLAETRADEDGEDQDEMIQAVMSALGGFVEKMEEIKEKADEFQDQYDERSAQLDALLEDFRSKEKEDMDKDQEDTMKNEDEQGKDRDDAVDPVNTERERLDWYNERRALESAAKRYDGIGDCDDLTNGEFRKAIVAAHFGEDRVDGASDAEIQGLFLAAEEIAKARKDSYDSAGDVVVKSRRDSAGGKKTAADRYREQVMNGYREDSSDADKIADKIAKALTE